MSLPNSARSSEPVQHGEVGEGSVPHLPAERSARAQARAPTFVTFPIGRLRPLPVTDAYIRLVSVTHLHLLYLTVHTLRDVKATVKASRNWVSA
jgi:hypothetical protein